MRLSLSSARRMFASGNSRRIGGMANQVSIYPTRFTDVDLDGNEIGVSWGLRVADDTDCAYSNMFEKDDIVGRTPAEIVELARGIDDRARAIIDFAEECRDGLHIGDAHYSWTELKPGSGGPTGA
jgi:hypothetical protein